MSVLFKITYGLYMVSATSDGKDSGCIVNTVMQQTAVPEVLSITINKDNFTTSLIEKTGKFVVNILAEDTSFDFFKKFGMSSSRDNDKFAGEQTELSKSGIKTITTNSVGYFEMEVTNKVDVGTHYMFFGKIVDSKLFEGAKAPVTYDYYHKNIKPKPQPKVADDVKVEPEQEVWECKICGYRHYGPMPDDFICPLCKHGKADFVRIK